MKHKRDIHTSIVQMSNDLQETKEILGRQKGSINDTFQLVEPMLQDMLSIMHDILDAPE